MVLSPLMCTITISGPLKEEISCTQLLSEAPLVDLISYYLGMASQCVDAVDDSLWVRNPLLIQVRWPEYVVGPVQA